MRPGDVVLALPSSGVHSNGFSLVRKVFDVEHADLERPLRRPGRQSLGEALLTPTRIYVKPVLAACWRRRDDPRHQPHHRRRLLREHSPHACPRA